MSAGVQRERSGTVVEKSDITHLSMGFKRLRCEVNRKKSKFERYGLIATIDLLPLVVYALRDLG